MASSSAAPASRTSELLEQLNRLSRSFAPDEIALRRVKSEARKMMSTNPADAHIILGAIGSIEGDAEATHHHHRTALRLEASAQVLQNYSISLMHLGQVAEALSQGREAHRLAPDDPKIVRQLISTATLAGAIVEACHFYDRWNRLVPDEPLPVSEPLRTAHQAIERGAFTESGTRNMMELAHALRAEARCTSSGGQLDKLECEEEGFVYTIFLFSSEEQALDLTWQFIDRFVHRPDLEEDPGNRFLLQFEKETRDVDSL